MRKRALGLAALIVGLAGPMGSLADQIVTSNAVSVISFDSAGFDATRASSPTHVYANGQHKIYYAGLPFANDMETGLATSADGVTYEKYSDDPIISHAEAPYFATFRTVPASVIFENGVYRLWFSGNNANLFSDSSNIAGFGYAASPDGVNWNIEPQPIRVATGALQVYRLVEVVKRGGQYIAYFVRSTSQASVLYKATSTDGIQFAGDIAVTFPGTGEMVAATVNNGQVIGLWRSSLAGVYDVGVSSDGVEFSFIRTLHVDPAAEPSDLEIANDHVTVYNTLSVGNVNWGYGNAEVQIATAQYRFGTGPVVVADREWRQLTETMDFTWNQISTVCNSTTGICRGSIGGVSFDGWTWANDADIAELFRVITVPSIASVFDRFLPTTGQSAPEARSLIGLSRTYANGFGHRAMVTDFTDPSLDDSVFVGADTNPDAAHAGIGVFLYRSSPVQQEYSVSPASAVVKESEGSVSFAVTRSPTTGAETVYVSTVQNQGFTNLGDYVGLQDMVVAFAAGEASKAVNIQLLDDRVDGEPDERFGLIVQKVPGPVTEYVASATFTIQDSNVPQGTYSISPATQTRKESDGVATFTVTRTVSTSAETLYVSTVQTYGVLNDNDYLGLKDVSLSFAAGDGEETVTIQLLDDQKAGEPDETFGLIVQKTPGPVTEFVAAATFTIQDTSVVPVPATPTNPAPGTVASPGPVLAGTSVTLSWDASSGATRYSVGMRDWGTGTLVVDTTTTSTSYVASLSADGQYRWNVAACNATDCSAFTTPLYFQTEAVVPPPGEPVLSVTPAGPINFGGPVDVKTEVAETLIVTNSGGGRLTGTCVASEPYSVANCAFDLPEKQSASFTLRFRPADPVPYPSNVLFFSNAKNEVTIDLQGAGKNAEPPPDKKPYVVFLPGLLGSRLWTVPSGSNNEIRSWFTVIDEDFLRLRPAEGGNVNEQSYTKPFSRTESESGILSTASTLRFDVYVAFIRYLDDLEERSVISGWEAIPYDWRKNVEDTADTDANNSQRGIPIKYDSTKPPSLVKHGSLVGRIKQLRADGHGPVTIVAHSLGGLLTKAVLSELETDTEVKAVGAAEFVERVVLVASPQLGTPKSLLGLLHGHVFDDSAPVSTEAIREVAENARSVFGLLPSTELLQRTIGVLVEFPALYTFHPLIKELNDTYGSSISTSQAGKLSSFILGGPGNRSEPASDDVDIPNVLNVDLFSNAVETHGRLDHWVSPAGIDVVQIIGTQNVDTARGIRYTAEKKCGLFDRDNCTAVLDWEPLMAEEASYQGDGTVVPASAAAMQAETYSVDLRSECQDGDDVAHDTILASKDVQDIIEAKLTGGTIDEADCVTKSMGRGDAERPFVPFRSVSTRSPVDLHLYDAQQRHTGLVSRVQTEGGVREVVEESIPNSSRNRYNGHETIVIEANGPYVARIDGTGTGVFTLISEEFRGNGQKSRVVYTDIPVSGATKGELLLPAYGKSGNLQLDFNGDGRIDSVVPPATDNDSRPALRSLVGYIGALPTPTGMKSSMTSKVTEAIKALDASDEATARGALRALVNFLRAQSGKQVPANVAQDLERIVLGIGSSI